MIKYFVRSIIIALILCINIYSQNWFPAEVGNKTLEKCLIYENIWGNVLNFFLINIKKDTVIDNQKYFLVQNSNYLKSILYEEKWLRYDPDSQKIFWRILDTSVVYMDFNIPDGGVFTQYNPTNDNTTNRTVFESTLNLFGNVYSLKGFVDSDLGLYMRKWIDGFGIKPLGINNPRIEQVLQFSGVDTTYLEYGYSPDFDSFSPILTADEFNFDFHFWVDHFYTQNNGSVLVDFIDSVYFDCYYKSDTDSIPTFRLNSVRVYQPYLSRRVTFNIDSALINNGYSFYYKVTAKDKGIIPKYTSSPGTGYYKITFTQTGLSTEDLFPIKFSLSQNYPNPFNPTTNIKYSIPSNVISTGGRNLIVTLKVYDVLGREVATLVNEEKQPGVYEVEFNPASGIRGLASGVYYYQLKAGDFIETKKMMVIK